MFRVADLQIVRGTFSTVKCRSSSVALYSLHNRGWCESNATRRCLYYARLEYASLDAQSLQTGQPRFQVLLYSKMSKNRIYGSKLDMMIHPVVVAPEQV